MNIDIRLEKKLADMHQRALEKNESKEILLPKWPDSKRGTPNSFLRSALFSAVKSRDRADFKEGQQLNQEDLTLWEALVHLAKESPLGDECEFTAYEILNSLNLTTGAEGYKTLHSGITRLTACAVEINKDGAGRGFMGSLIEFSENHNIESTTRYKLKLGRMLIKLYNDNTCWIDFGQRQLLKRKPLAQFLYGYYSSHQSSYPLKIETLHKLSGSNIKSMTKYKQNLDKAHHELKKIDFIDDHGFDDNGLVWIKRKLFS
jgi:hypothetical protein